MSDKEKLLVILAKQDEQIKKIEYILAKSEDCNQVLKQTLKELEAKADMQRLSLKFIERRFAR